MELLTRAALADDSDAASRQDLFATSHQFLREKQKNEKGLPQKVKFSNNRWELDITST